MLLRHRGVKRAIKRSRSFNSLSCVYVLMEWKGGVDHLETMSVDVGSFSSLQTSPWGHFLWSEPAGSNACEESPIPEKMLNWSKYRYFAYVKYLIDDLISVYCVLMSSGQKKTSPHTLTQETFKAMVKYTKLRDNSVNNMSTF